MPQTTTPRPAQVTIAAWLVMAGSVFVVLTAFDQIAGLRSLETREAVEEFLSKPPGDSLGLGVQGMLSVMRVLTMVTAACATAAAILGFHVLRRSRSARLVLTLLAVPLFLAGMVVGGFLPAVIVGSITMLWFQPARDWIDGKAPRPVTPPPPPASSPAPTPPMEAPPRAAPPATSDGPRAYPGFGETPGVPPPGAMTYTAHPQHPAAPARPAALMWACALAWAGSAVVFIVMLVSVAVVLAAPDMLVDELYRQNPELRSDGITPATLRSTVLFAGSLLVVWSVVASVLAAYAWRGRSWAWTALVVSACSASVLCLLAALGSPAMLVPLMLCAATIPLLLRPEVRAFIRGSSHAR
ncbi:hypothetical protein [Nocardioides dilutus]